MLREAKYAVAALQRTLKRDADISQASLDCLRHRLDAVARARAHLPSASDSGGGGSHCAHEEDDWSGNAGSEHAGSPKDTAHPRDWSTLPIRETRNWHPVIDEVDGELRACVQGDCDGVLWRSGPIISRADDNRLVCEKGGGREVYILVGSLNLGARQRLAFLSHTALSPHGPTRHLR